MYADREDFIADLVAVTLTQIRALDHDARLADLLRASITENVVAAIHYLDLDAPEIPPGAPAAALGYARTLAQRDVPLSALIRAYRIGHARFLDAAMRHASALPGHDRVAAIVELVNRSARWIDLVCDQVGVAYERERDRWVSRRSGLRQQWVGQVIAGNPIDVTRAEEALGYRLGGTHIAAVLWADADVPTPEVVELFDRARSVLATALGAIGPALMVPTDEREARLWFSVRSAELASTSRVRSAVEKAGIKVHVAFGDVSDGLVGFRQSMRRAERVKALALAGGHRPARLTFYREVAPTALMAGDLEDLRAFVGDVLGELGVDDERTRLLRETLREFLARNRSYVATADAMILHRNTIQYRVAQATELCGLSFDDPDAVLKVQVALEACRWMAPGVLRAPG
ncbi:PucR family transcriptional regulator [Mycobacterium sp. Marseille-P9652]|uniref:PucR family transcriptional regulator n=1 Tax=Mycobacterium sp. Marseille-P9652 TaxID=2654950 RepID=UPI00351A3AA7